MAAKAQMDYQVRGDVVLERLKAQPLPKTLTPYVKVFQKEHVAYDKACSVADKARAARDAALVVVGEADAVLDGSLDTLAAEMIGAKAGTRKSPFAKFSRYSVSQLKSLATKKEADEVLAMGGKIAKASLPKSVNAVSAACVKHATAVKQGLAKLVAPQAAYRKALEDRDALLPGWVRAFSRMKKVAAVAWLDDEATYRSVFAPVEGIQAPKAKRAKKAPAQPVDG